ncbi:hypothetical protein FQR65_LT19086 [Abscondita terminalis]|nr:hypothetical protein FQR65_LT19086 [Abscondita terminalis]
MSQQQAELLEGGNGTNWSLSGTRSGTIESGVGLCATVIYFSQGMSDLSSPSLRNRVSALTNGEEKFPAFLKAIREAKHAIHVEYYIFELDNIGLEVLNALEEKADEGVKFPEQAAVAFTSSDPGSVGPFNMEAILLAISEAKNRVQLCTPYYIPK